MVGQKRVPKAFGPGAIIYFVCWRLSKSETGWWFPFDLPLNGGDFDRRGPIYTSPDVRDAWVEVFFSVATNL